MLKKALVCSVQAPEDRNRINERKDDRSYFLCLLALVVWFLGILGQLETVLTLLL